MNYTENYHLPQWDETDRIMRVDFNQMCADIEAGLTGSAQASQDACQNSDALDKKTLRRLCRLAYNHYNAIQGMNSAPWQVGMFYQNPAKDGSNVTGTQLWNGVCFSGKGTAAVMPDALSDHIEQLTSLKTVKGNLAASSPMTIAVYAPWPVYIDHISLTGSYSNNTANASAPIQLTLINQNSGEVELIKQLDLAQKYTAAQYTSYFDVFIPFHAGQHYLLKLEPLAAIYDSEFNLRLDSTQTLLRSFSNFNSITATHTIREYAGSSGGLLIVRGLVTGDGKLTVKWDGKEVPLHTARMIGISDGRQMREMVYLRDEPVPAVTTFSLRFDNGTCSSFLFYDWGAVLL